MLKTYLDLSEFQKVAKSHEWWNKSWRTDQILNYMSMIDFRGKRVLETGSRYGMFAYIAYTMGAEHVTGVEYDKRYVWRSRMAFRNSGVPKQKYRIEEKDLYEFDMRGFDVILFLGVFYNDFEQENLLFKCRGCPVVLFESWTDKNDEKYPVLTEVQYRHAHDNSPYRQYRPNVARLESQLSDAGFDFKRLNDPLPDGQPDGCDMFYYLTPSSTKTHYKKRWGISAPLKLS